MDLHAIRSQVSPARARWAVLTVALIALGFKLWLAATTKGTNDVATFQQFAKVIGRVGPAGIYGVKHAAFDVYNHPPLTGDLLWVFFHAAHHGLKFSLLIRLPACFADLVTSLLVFELVRRWRGSPGRAMWAGIGAAASPILVIISGFHGNTDPVFVMFVLLSVWLLAHREMPLWAGVALGLALSVKVVPLVVLPVILLWALLHSRRTLLLFCTGLAVTLAVVWGPAVVEHWPQVRDNVLGYNGWSSPQWGGAAVLRDMNLTYVQLVWVLDNFRTVVVGLSAALGMFLVWRRRDALGPAVGLTLGCLLLLSTATGTQYLAWAAATLFLAEFWSALLYNIAGGLFLYILYGHWSNGTWNLATGAAWSSSDAELGILAWAALMAGVVCGVRAVLRTPRQPSADRPAAPVSTEETSAPHLSTRRRRAAGRPA
jgi:hypothetical protein